MGVLALVGGDGTPITSSTTWPDVAHDLGIVFLILIAFGLLLLLAYHLIWPWVSMKLEHERKCHMCPDDSAKAPERELEEKTHASIK